MSLMTQRAINIGHSPDPDDAFMFYGLASGNVRIRDIILRHHIENIQSLNERAMTGELEVTAISAHTYPYLAGRYWIMRTGSSMGEGYGPVIISREYKTLEQLRGKIVGTPGRLTTATLLFKLFTNGIENVDMPFDEIIPRIANGNIDAGLLIHEGQLTYPSLGYNKILDFGELWRDQTSGLPLPLGLDIVRTDLGEPLAQRLSDGLRESILYGRDHSKEAMLYAMQWGRGLTPENAETFVRMYVSQLTIDMGDAGRRALEHLFRIGRSRGFLPAVADLKIL